MKSHPYALLFVFILLLILFDASQQKFYIDTFNLSEKTIPLGQLVIAHFIRWVIWLGSAIPLGYILWKRIFLTNDADGLPHPISFILYILPVLFIVLTLISVVSLTSQGLPVSFGTLEEFIRFYFYQKGMTFFMAYAGMVLWLFNFAKSKQIDTQWLEIKELRESNKNHNLPGYDTVPQINVKVGSRVKPILIRDISWIQADDYCVRIHTNKQSYCLRKSLKFLERELAPYRFVRIHRGALLNLDFLDQVDFDAAIITLQDNSKLPISRTGEQILRRQIKAQSL